LILKRKLIRQNYGIYIIALWSVILGAQNLTNLLLISLSTQGEPAGGASVSLVLLYQLLSVGFSLSFFIAAVGLWVKANWARVLFLVTVSLFFVVSFIGLLAPQLDTPTTAQKWLLGVRYTLSAALPLVYLNWGPIKDKFNPTFESEINDD